MERWKDGRKEERKRKGGTKEGRKKDRNGEDRRTEGECDK